MDHLILPLPDLAGVTPSVKNLAAGDILFRRGADTTAIYRLASGRLRLVRTTVEGSEVPVHTARAGELFAEAALFSPVYHCDAVALKDSVVLAYPKPAVLEKFTADPAAMMAFAADMASRLQGLRTQLEIRHVRSAHERILQALRLRVDRGGCWAVEGTLMQFAEELGLTHEAMYRALAKLEGEGKITRQEGRLCLA